MSRSSEGQGHNAVCLWKGLDLSNNVCEYEENWLTNENLKNWTLRFQHKVILAQQDKCHVFGL